MRLYLVSLLGDGEQHGYQLLRTLKARVGGDYSPSAGTVYPRLRQLEREGIVVARPEAGRILYRLTELGEAALQAWALEIEELESELARVSRGSATQLRAQVHESARELRDELRTQAEALRRRPAEEPFGIDLHRQLARVTAEWSRLVTPDTSPALARMALATAIDLALEQLRQLLATPSS